MVFSGIEAFQQSDTSPAARRAYFEALRRAGPGKRLRRALELSELTRRLSFDGLRERNPGVPEEELQVLFVRQLYGPAAAQALREHQARSRR